MVTTLVLALCLLICQAQSQLCGPGLFSGALGSGPFGPLSQSFNAAASPCIQPVPPCGIQVPSCGIQAPILNNNAPNFIPSPTCGQCSPFPCNQPCGQCSPFGSNLSPIIAPSCVSTCECLPQGPVACIDNTLANTLANAIQLLIVSNLLENNPCGNSLNYSPICETNYPCANVIEILTPEYYPCNQIVTCEPVYETVIAPYVEVPCYQEPRPYAPCIEVNPCGPIFGPNFGSDLAFDSCGLVNPYPNTFGCSDNCGLVNPFGNNFCCSDNCGLVNPFPNGFGCIDPVFAPAAAEVLFPAEIPAQLLCNFGYMPANVPCVSVNVEPLPFDSCSCNNGFVY